MNNREKMLQVYMNKNLKISTLFAYKFKTCEIIKAIQNMTTNLPQQQWYFLQLQNFKKQRAINNKKKYEANKIKEKMYQCLLETEKLKFIINQRQIQIQNLLAKRNKIDLFIKKQQILQEKPLDLSSPKQELLLQVEIQKNFQQSNSIYQSNFNDIQAHLLNQQLAENDYLNTTNKETYSNTASDKQKQVSILRIG